MPFGLIELDPETQARAPRPSADLYATIAQGNTITPELVEAYAPSLRPILMPGASVNASTAPPDLTQPK
jgi:hypothetical protein